MEQIDGTLLRIIFSVVGFTILALISIIVWLFKNQSAILKELSSLMMNLKLEVAEVKSSVESVKTSVQREIDLMRDIQKNVQDKAEKNTEDIASLDKNVAVLTEWKRAETIKQEKN